jgi:potassium-dependent mechanosensitive channel
MTVYYVLIPLILLIGQPSLLSQLIPAVPLESLEIEAERPSSETRTDLDEEQRQLLADLAAKTQAVAEQERQHRAYSAELRRIMESAPSEIAQAEAEIAALRSASPAVPGASLDAAATQAVIERLMVEAPSLTEQVSTLEREIEQLSSRHPAARRELEELLQQRADLALRLAAPPPSPETELSLAQRLLLKSELAERDANIERIETELRTQESREKLLSARRNALIARDQSARASLAAFVEHQDRLRAETARESRQQAKAVERDPLASEAQRAAAAENERLGALLLRLTQQTHTLRAELQTRKDQLESLQQAHERVRRILAITNLPATYAEQLRQERRRTTPWRVLARDASLRHEQHSERRLLQLEIESALRHLRSTPPEVNPELSKLQSTATEMLGQISNVLSEAERYTFDLDATEARLAVESQSLATLLDRRLVWIRSLPPFGPALWKAQSAAWSQALKDPARYWGSPSEHLATLVSRAPLIVAALLLIGLLFQLSRRARRGILRLGEKTGRLLTDRFAYTIEAFALSLIAVLPWPALFGALGIFLHTVPNGELVQGAGYGLLHGAWVLLVLQMIREWVRAGGIADRHFAWNDNDRQALFRVAGWVRWLLPLPLITVLGANWNGEEWLRSGSGRVGFVVIMLVSALFSHRLLRSRTALLVDWQQNAAPWTRRLFRLFTLLCVLTPLLLVAITLRGYYYTARLLALHTAMSLGLLFGMVVFYHTALRWLVVARRRYAISQARERRETSKAQGSPEGGTLPAKERNIREELEQIDLQTRKLLRFSVVLTALILLAGIWRPMLPALNALEDINVGEAQGRVLTLWDIGRALLTAVFTVIAARNLPGLIEIIIPTSVPLSRSSRYAVTTLSRYVIVITGMVLGFGYIGIGWNQVQWLAAAVTVGLGFGLQEIFANFVSGIIILFEQPIRVGDVVTVDGVSGTVTRIRMRATTITNWERKEYIVPNKEFVTGRLMNWTLTDSINRVVVAVGVAYGSDIDKAMAALHKVAEEHPAVLKDPAPAVSFEAFGDNALNLQLRVYLASLDDRLKHITALHRAVYLAMNEAGIEISFPQRDLHLRTIPPEMAEWMQQSIPRTSFGDSTPPPRPPA